MSRGAAHEVAGRPLQDAAGFAGDQADGRQWLALAVADGHGGHRHFRSARGSEFAVEAAVELARETAPRFAAAETPRTLHSAGRTELVPAVIRRWRDAVAEDLVDSPLTEGERRQLAAADVTVAYGSTLLLAVVAEPWLVLCQIGDGDIVMVGTDGMASAPIPRDPRLDGQTTTSLCQPDAADAFRLAVVSLPACPVAALLLATDGFGNAQTADPWYQPVGADLLQLAREHGTDWMSERLPVWAARCASAEGSGDDTALALLLREETPGRPGPLPHRAVALSTPGPQPWPAMAPRLPGAGVR